MCWLSLLTVVFVSTPALALLCYDSPRTNLLTKPEEPTLKNCSRCDYCVFSIDPMAGDDAVPDMFGTGPEVEDTSLYASAFGKSKYGLAHGKIISYNILNMCVLEKYAVRGSAQYVLRCFCRTDGCNWATSLQDYVQRAVMNNIDAQEQ